MSREEEKSWAVFKPEVYGEQATKVVSNVCFAFLVIGVLTFTVLAVTYQPPDPWLQSSAMFAKIVSNPQNSNFVPDESVIVTAEDTPLLLPVSLPPAINQSSVDEEIALGQRNSGACDTSGPINCSAPGVLFAIESYNLQLFTSLDFYEYRTPLRGSAPNECDVAWKYRSSKDGSPRMFRDFRRFSLSRLDNCEFHVDGVGDWHSGDNARPRRKSAFAPETSVAEIGVDVIDDGLVNISENSFLNGKYLYYERGGDHCKDMNQYMWSLLCALGEARYLNRTFVMDLEVCLPSSNEPKKDFRFYYDYEHLRKSMSLIDRKQFLGDWDAWEAKHQARKAEARVVGYQTTPMELKGDESTVVKRVFNEPEPNNYWFRVCEGESEKAIQRPWDLVWKSRRINDIVLAICGKMGWEYDAVHVVRGEKVNNKLLWPHLDEDTSPEALVRKLDERISEGRNVYIATNEQFDHYFDKLRGKWRIFQLEDFKELWAEGSEWYKETMELNGGKPVEFDSYMRVEVDSEVLYKAKTRIETFGDLTKDCKNGIDAC